MLLEDVTQSCCEQCLDFVPAAKNSFFRLLLSHLSNQKLLRHGRNSVFVSDAHPGDAPGRQNPRQKRGRRDRHRRLRKRGLRIGPVQIPAHIRIPVSRVRLAGVQLLLLVQPGRSGDLPEARAPVQHHGELVRLRRVGR